MKLGCIFTVTCLVGCLAGEITEPTSKVTSNGGFTAVKVENIPFKCNMGRAMMEFPGYDDVKMHQLYVVGDGMSCTPAITSRNLSSQLVGHSIYVECTPFEVVEFKRDLGQ